MEDSAQENNQEFINNSSNPLSSFFSNASIKYILIGVFCAFIVNIVVLDILFFNLEKKTSENSALIVQNAPPPCTENCSAKLAQVTPAQQDLESSSKAAQPAIDSSPTSIPSLAPTTVPTDTPTLALREYFVPLGQGSGTYTDWTVVPGIGAKIKISNYGEIDKAYFEVTVRVPAGSQIVNVRLYNSSSSQSIANSELTLASNTSTLLISSPITLTQTQDENLYQVQLKTQLGATTYIDQARIRIVSR